MEASQDADQSPTLWPIAVVLSVLLVLIVIGIWAAARTSYVIVHGERIASEDRKSFDDVDHSAWDDLLNKYVDEAGMVDYRHWHGSDADREKLSRYLETLSSGDATLKSSRAGKLAFYINAYNALTIEAILNRYPTESIRDHVNPVGFNLWDHVKLRVGDEQLSLTAIEHERLRTMNEPRIHFAIVCASISCPRLLNEAYLAETLEQQLSGNTRHFFAQSSNFQFDTERNIVKFNPILSWFKSDFGATQSARMKTISPYLPSEEARKLVLQPELKVEFLNYNWNLNEQRR